MHPPMHPSISPSMHPSICLSTTKYPGGLLGRDSGGRSTGTRSCVTVTCCLWGVVKGEGGEATWAGRVAQRLSEATGNW